MSLHQKPFLPKRLALTLVEVLVSMGIMTIGLLGVASLFPVGGHYMKSGEVADAAGAIAQAALDDAIVRGHLDPENWVIHDAVSSMGDNRFARFITGKGFDGGGSPFNGIGLEDSLSSNGDTVYGMSKTATTVRPAIHGGSFIIDPQGMASILSDNSEGNRLITKANRSMPLRHFPGMEMFSPQNSQWFPWHASGAMWPVRRVTTAHSTQALNGSSTFSLNEPIGKLLFSSTDDLLQVQPKDGDTPVRLRAETWNNGGNLTLASRQSQGNYSWIISVSPGSSEARDALASSPGSYQYDVSVVVFYKRVLGLGYEGALEAERLVTAKVVSTGIAGGELLLDKRANDNVTGSPFEELRAGQYIMLTGPHPQSTEAHPRLFNQWYKVQSIEDSGSPIVNGSQQNLDGENKVLVSLRGPDWPWEAYRNGSVLDLTDTSQLPNDLRVTIIPGAVAVHTKTMRLDAGSSWGN